MKTSDGTDFLPARIFRRGLPAAILAISIIPAASGIARSQGVSGDGGGSGELDSLREKIVSVMDNSSIPGMSVAVLQGGRIVWAEGIGTARVETGEGVEPSTGFPLGTLSKVLTTTLCARMVDEGLLDWDAPVESYLEEFPFSGRGVTIRLIASHKGGFSSTFEREHKYMAEHFDSADEVLKLFLQEPLAYEPGSKTAYATTSYTVIAAVVERVSGKKFHRCMREYVLDPLGMTGTEPYDPAAGEAGRAGLYRKDRYGDINPTIYYDPSYMLAGGGYLSTAEDLVKLAGALMEPGFIKAKTLGELFLPVKENSGRGGQYALGWTVGNGFGGVRMIHKTGAGTGMSTLLGFYPSEGLAVAILTNLERAPVSGSIFNEICNYFMNRPAAVRRR